MDAQFRLTFSVTLTGVAVGAGGSGAKSKNPIVTPTILIIVQQKSLAIQTKSHKKTSPEFGHTEIGWLVFVFCFAFVDLD